MKEGDEKIIREVYKIPSIFDELVQITYSPEGKPYRVVEGEVSEHLRHCYHLMADKSKRNHSRIEKLAA